ncbi:MAG: phosphatase PAP2 family protein [Bacteriovoracaceae bacterium]|nr:phosphatase PAP2 family protein [Bacteroidota bacterium]
MNQFIVHIQRWDERTILRIIAKRGLSLTKFMKFVSMVGDGFVWAILAVLFYVFTDVSLTWLYVGLSAFSVELICYKLIKQSTTRKRPFRVNACIENLVVPQDEYSFPSGHTAAATVAALLFSTAVPVFIPFFVAMTILIGLSRIYLGVHYPTDVLMGFTLGVLSFSFASFIL